MMTTLISDIRYGLRQIPRSPGFSATVILTMALGVGANVIVFSCGRVDSGAPCAVG
jgi:hypothetical protein